MNIIPFIIQLIALICLLIAALNLLQPSRVLYGWLGLFFWLLSLMVGVIDLHPTLGAH
jgi:hypothetical protein